MELDLHLPLWQWALIFAAGSAVLVRAGITLAEAGDEIADRTGLGRMLVGMLLVAGATSLPEVFTDMSASIVGAPDIGIGDLMGSSMANMAILGLLDLVHRNRVWPTVELGHARVASVGIVLTGIAVMAILTPPWLVVGWVGIESILICVFYVAVIAWIRRSPDGREARLAEFLPVPARGPGSEDSPGPDGAAAETGLRTYVVRFALAALAILVAAPVVAVSGQGIAEQSGLGETFVGALFVAIATSLPELVASLAALRLGAYDLAVGNVYGSNAFNMTIILFADLAYTEGPILKAVSQSQAVAGVGAIILMALTLAAIVHGRETRIARVEPDGLLVLFAYVGVVLAVFAASV